MHTGEARPVHIQKKIYGPNKEMKNQISGKRRWSGERVLFTHTTVLNVCTLNSRKAPCTEAEERYIAWPHQFPCDSDYVCMPVYLSKGISLCSSKRRQQSRLSSHGGWL